MRSAACGAVACAAAADASTLQITDHGCRRGVELVAQDAPLREVLERLAATLGFRLEVEGELVETIRMRTTAPPGRLVADLLASQPGHVVWYAPDPRCPQHRRVARVRLVAGAATVATTPASAPKVATRPAGAAPMVRAPVTEIATPQHLREVERASHLRKAEYDAYVRRHGQPPAGEEEEAARP
jgi:hypothetical protein